METGSHMTAHTTTQSAGIELRRIPVHLSRGTRAFRVHPRLHIGLQATKKRLFTRLSLHPKIPFPAPEAATAQYPRQPENLGSSWKEQRTFQARAPAYCGFNPRASNCWLHSGGASPGRSLLQYREATICDCLFTTKRQKDWAVSVAGTMQISAGKLALRFLSASLSQLECELVA
jgi:hypothetical protein